MGDWGNDPSSVVLSDADAETEAETEGERMEHETVVSDTPSDIASDTEGEGEGEGEGDGESADGCEEGSPVSTGPFNPFAKPSSAAAPVSSGRGSALGGTKGTSLIPSSFSRSMAGGDRGVSPLIPPSAVGATTPHSVLSQEGSASAFPPMVTPTVSSYGIQDGMPVSFSQDTCTPAQDSQSMVSPVGASKPPLSKPLSMADRMAAQRLSNMSPALPSLDFDLSVLSIIKTDHKRETTKRSGRRPAEGVYDPLSGHSQSQGEGGAPSMFGPLSSRPSILSQSAGEGEREGEGEGMPVIDPMSMLGIGRRGSSRRERGSRPGSRMGEAVTKGSSQEGRETPVNKSQRRPRLHCKDIPLDLCLTESVEYSTTVSMEGMGALKALSEIPSIAQYALRRVSPAVYADTITGGIRVGTDARTKDGFVAIDRLASALVYYRYPEEPVSVAGLISERGGGVGVGGESLFRRAWGHYSMP
ncbi:hypothetical protein KIPB_010807, partial [Kipferlia bialata]|eukprot:g8908.t1